MCGGFSFENDLLSGSLNKAGTVLTIRGFTQFTDGSGRSNYSTIGTFTKAS
jgi:hypothetical protein